MNLFSILNKKSHSLLFTTLILGIKMKNILRPKYTIHPNCFFKLRVYTNQVMHAQYPCRVKFMGRPLVLVVATERNLKVWDL